MSEDEALSKLETFGFSFWMCNTALWFIIFLTFTYKVQPHFLQKSGNFNLIGRSWCKLVNSRGENG